jgi:lipoprotein-anchoring transpeptidase ErfK/SrfK
MLRRRPDLPHHMAGGPDNPMGARGIYLGANEDVIDLYNRVRIGATVIVQ